MKMVDNDTIIMRGPDNGHAHFRQGPFLPPFLIKKFIESGWRWRVVAEPNIRPENTTGQAAISHCVGISEHARKIKGGNTLEPVPVMQITEATTPRA
jgi:hypothetical protein